MAEKRSFDVRVMCKVLGVSTSAYYGWKREQQSAHELRDAELQERIRELFTRFRGRYGAPRIHAQLSKEGVHTSRKRVARLLREAGLRAKGARKYKATTDSGHTLGQADHLQPASCPSEHLSRDRPQRLPHPSVRDPLLFEAHAFSQAVEFEIFIQRCLCRCKIRELPDMLRCLVSPQRTMHL